MPLEIGTFEGKSIKWDITPQEVLIGDRKIFPEDFWWGVTLFFLGEKQAVSGNFDYDIGTSGDDTNVAGYRMDIFNALIWSLKQGLKIGIKVEEFQWALEAALDCLPLALGYFPLKVLQPTRIAELSQKRQAITKL